MSSSSPLPLIGTRVDAHTKARLEALALSQGKSVSQLLRAMIDVVLEENPIEQQRVSMGQGTRLAVRLYAGDREGLNVRATELNVSLSAYVAMLIHAHVSGVAPMTQTEFDTLKVAIAEVSAVRRALQALAHHNNVITEQPRQLASLLETAGDSLESLRSSVRTLIATNAARWEIDHAQT